MNERVPSGKGGIELRSSGEILRPRLEITEGELGAFRDAIAAAAGSGVETVDVMRAESGIAVSSVSEMNKFSKEYSVCTGLAVLGRTSDGRVLSFLSHKFPTVNPDFMRVYSEILHSKLREILDRTVPGSFESGFFGGTYLEGVDSSDPFASRYTVRNNWYENIRELVGGCVRDVAGQEMRVVTQPSTDGKQMNAFLDTQGAKLYIERY